MCEFSANIAAARPEGLEEVFLLGGQKHAVPTSFGPISVVVYGDRCKSPLVTYPDVALNYESCFQGLFRCPEASSLLSNFCTYHIDAPGHEAGAKAIDSDHPMLSVEDLADQVAEVLDYFRLWGVMCMGVTAGAYILTLFALKYRERVNGLILVSPLCRAPSWTEWIYNEVTTNLLYYGGMCDLAKEILLQRHFSKDSPNALDEDSDKRRSYCKTLDERQSTNVIRYMHAINRRLDLTNSLKNLKCRTLVFVGELSPFHHEAVHLNNHMDRNYNALVEVQVCGTLVTEEQPHSMLIPMEYFLMGYGFYRPCLLSRSSSFSSPSSPLSPLCISPELLSPESLGVKLRPIKTRVPMEDEEEEEPFL